MTYGIVRTPGLKGGSAGLNLLSHLHSGATRDENHCQQAARYEQPFGIHWMTFLFQVRLVDTT
jgi:hypothetical protein